MDEAIRAYEEALRIAPRLAPAALALSQIHLSAGDPDKAEALARQVLDRQPTNAVGRSLLVRIELVRGNIANATAELAKLKKGSRTPWLS